MLDHLLGFRHLRTTRLVLMHMLRRIPASFCRSIPVRGSDDSSSLLRSHLPNHTFVRLRPQRSRVRCLASNFSHAYSSLSMDHDAEQVVSFWFDRPPIEWIIAPEGLDEQIKSKFLGLVLKARNDDLEAWAESPNSSLALIVLLEQFPRNVYRGSQQAFSSDTKAYDIAMKAIAQEFDKQVSVIQASAFYMPLMQQESLISVLAAKALFEGLKTRCSSEEERQWVDMGVAAMKRHSAQLVRFGRYPTRNKLLGRENTEDEEAFLKDFTPTL
jgi:uncharacterized protein (DUF924 family)